MLLTQHSERSHQTRLGRGFNLPGYTTGQLHTLLLISLVTCHSHLLHTSPVQALKHEEDSTFWKSAMWAVGPPNAIQPSKINRRNRSLYVTSGADAGASATGSFTPSRSTAEDCWEDRSDALHSTYITLPPMAETQERSL